MANLNDAVLMVHQFAWKTAQSWKRKLVYCGVRSNNWSQQI